MIPSDYDALVDGIREAGDIHTYLKMVGLVALIESGLSQSTIRHAAEDALDLPARTSRHHARVFFHLHQLSKLCGNDLAARPPRSP